MTPAELALRIRTILVIRLPAAGAEAVSCYVLLHRVDGRGSQATSVAFPAKVGADGHREREFRRPRIQPGVYPHGMTTRPRAASSPPDATGRMDGLLCGFPSVVRTDSRTSHARPAFGQPRTGRRPLQLSRRYPVVACGGLVASEWFTPFDCLSGAQDKLALWASREGAKREQRRDFTRRHERCLPSRRLVGRWHVADGASGLTRAALPQARRLRALRGFV